MRMGQILEMRRSPNLPYAGFVHVSVFLLGWDMRFDTGREPEGFDEHFKLYVLTLGGRKALDLSFDAIGQEKLSESLAMISDAARMRGQEIEFTDFTEGIARFPKPASPPPC